MLRAVLAALAIGACGDARPATVEVERDAGPSVPSDSGSAPAPPDAALAGWSPRAALPRPMQEVVVVALGGKVYVLGGFDDAGKTLADVVLYDPATDAWSAGVPLPRPLHHINAAVVADRIWITGALEGASFGATGITLVLADGGWSERKPMPGGTERGASMTAAIGKTIYVAGGLRGGAVAEFSAYDTELDTWTSLPPLPTPRDHGGGVATGGLFYAVSGRAGAHTPRVDVFDPATSAWSPRAPMPTSRAGSAIALVDGLILVFGGEGGTVFAQAEAYTIATDTWSSLAPMPTPRHGTGAAALDRVVYVPGGGTREGFGATAIVEAYRF